ncbi:MAG: SIR2 family protein [Pirellulales bacterium]
MIEVEAASENVESIPDDLTGGFDHTYGRGVVAFVGSGPSLDSALPQWESLLLGIAKACQRDKDVQASLSAGRLLDVAQYLAHETSEAAVREKAALIIRDCQPKRLDIQKQIVALPLVGIVTTNYDHLLVAADTERQFSAPISHRTSGLREHLRQRFMFHLHGHIGDPDSIVLTKASYDTFALGNQKQTLEFMRGVFQAHTVLFIGFGFRDENIDSMLRTFVDHGITSDWSVFALVPSSRAADKVLDHALRRRNVNPIYFGCELSSWLEMLNHTVFAMNRALQSPVSKQLSPSMIARIRALLETAEYIQIARTALGASERADLRELAKTQEALNWPDLMNRIDGGEMRTLLRSVNNVRRHELIENALACLPPRNQE